MKPLTETRTNLKKKDILKLLSRTDKWYLGGGGRLLWAPQFPRFLDQPGFWDTAHYYNFGMQPLFTWTLLDDHGRQIRLQSKGRTWTPAELKQRFASRVNKDISIEETKVVLPNSVAASQIALKSRSRKAITLHLVAWTAQETNPSVQTTWVSGTGFKRDRLCFEKHVRGPQHTDFSCSVVLGINRTGRSHALNLSEGILPPPDWSTTPFSESFRGGRLPGESRLSGVTDDGVIFGAIHTRVTIKPGSTESLTVAMAFDSGPREASQSLTGVLGSDAAALSRMTWREYFGTLPYFQCSDEHLTRYYWYRWYGLRLNTVWNGEGNYNYPFVCEGIGYFRAPISYSAPAQMLETRWMHDPELARGILLTFVDNQREDGGFRGYIDPSYYREELFYHANWGRALQELEHIHPSKEFLAEVYDALKRYVQYFDRERDEAVSGLYDIHNHYETGQEYMRRYTVVHPDADRSNWGRVFRLKGVDVTVYIYELKRALGALAARTEKLDEAELWNLEAERIKTAMLQQMWDPYEEMFSDVDPATGERTMVKAATCFHPYLTDIVSKEHLPGLKRHLLNKKEFWTPFPVPSSSADDAMFSAYAGWKGKRMNCPWNGRVWPMTNSHIAEALATNAIRFNDNTLKQKTVEFILGFITMMFFDGDSKRPNCFEHYNPLTGQPSLYRGFDDYMHSWVNDVIIKYVCGIRPGPEDVTIDPFPFALSYFVIDDVIIGKKRIRIQRQGNNFTVWIDGRLRKKSSIGKPLHV